MFQEGDAENKPNSTETRQEVDMKEKESLLRKPTPKPEAAEADIMDAKEGNTARQK
jgi:hypothetical protein